MNVPKICFHCDKTKNDDENVENRGGTCSRCSFVWYCSREHQRLNHKIHKGVCKVLATFASSPPDDESFTRDRMRLKGLLENSVRRPLTSRESQLWMFPRFCAHCLKIDFKVSEETVECTSCSAVQYCNEDHLRLHRRVHAEICSDLKLQSDFRMAMYGGRLKLMRDDPRTIADGLQGIFEPDRVKTPEDVNATHILSHIATLLHALELTGSVSNSVAKSPDMIVHVIGASIETINFNRYCCEILFHSIVNLRTLRIFFIGPEVPPQEDDSWALCKECELKKATIVYGYSNLRYDEFCLLKGFKAPTVKLIFSCGFTEGHSSDDYSWRDTFPCLFYDSSPVMFTSYTYDEGVEDCDIIEGYFECNVSYVIKNKTNPFKSFLPIRDCMDVNKIYYNNNYFSILRLS